VAVAGDIAPVSVIVEVVGPGNRSVDVAIRFRVREPIVARLVPAVPVAPGLVGFSAQFQTVGAVADDQHAPAVDALGALRGRDLGLSSADLDDGDARASLNLVPTVFLRSYGDKLRLNINVCFAALQFRVGDSSGE